MPRSAFKFLRHVADEDLIKRSSCSYPVAEGTAISPVYSAFYFPSERFAEKDRETPRATLHPRPRAALNRAPSAGDVVAGVSGASCKRELWGRRRLVCSSTVGTVALSLLLRWLQLLCVQGFFFVNLYLPISAV